MSQQFKLEWDNTRVMDSSNSISQRALYRYKNVGGEFESRDFTPPNDMDVSVNTAISPLVDDNRVLEFQVETECIMNGPAINDNGIQEAIGFACIPPNITKTEATSDIFIDITGLDITKARFTLRKSSDNTLIGSVISNAVGDTISGTMSGLVHNTGYYWQIELYAIVGLIEVISSDGNQLGTVCSPYPFTTDSPAVCDPITMASVSSTEL